MDRIKVSLLHRSGNHKLRQVIEINITIPSLHRSGNEGKDKSPGMV
jgi:hypothetical protein